MSSVRVCDNSLLIDRLSLKNTLRNKYPIKFQWYWYCTPLKYFLDALRGCWSFCSENFVSKFWSFFGCSQDLIIYTDHHYAFRSLTGGLNSDQTCTLRCQTMKPTGSSVWASFLPMKHFFPTPSPPSPPPLPPFSGELLLFNCSSYRLLRFWWDLVISSWYILKSCFLFVRIEPGSNRRSIRQNSSTLPLGHSDSLET